MCLVINDSFGTDLNEKMFHTYFLANHNFMYQGLTNYHEFIAGVYPMLKLGSFSGKLLLTKFSKSTENFIIEFEKGFTTK
jgi:hypothetical protein